MMNKKISLKNREEFTYYLFMYLKNKDRESFREEFLDLHPTDQVDIFMQMSEEKRQRVYKYLSADEFSEIFQGLELSAQKTVFAELEEEYSLKMLDDLHADDITDFLGNIPDAVSSHLLENMNPKEAANIKLLLSFKDDTAGSIMTTEYITANPDNTAAEVMEKLRIEGTDAETIYYIYTVNENGSLIGILSLRELITSPPSEIIENIMKEQLITVSPFADQEEVSRLIKDYDLLAVPVTTSEGKLIGIVTVDDILDVIEEENTEDIGAFAAAGRATDLDMNAFQAAKIRLPWLILLLGLGTLTAGLIGSFEATLAELALLAMFVPLIADMAGNTGTQSLAIVVRGIALGKVGRGRYLQLLKREVLTGLMMGVVCGVLVALITMAVPMGNALLGFIIGVSLFMTVVVSGLTGTIIPLLIHKTKVDPAVASGPFITTVNDIVALFIYFSIATSLLNYL
ncbi:magnesium transporter [Evansella clarkii]|jgi:magnesium transporter|uniref:magnesium transporter n=1 Tax=Evansella clarkii TaxID=79879 RepID=UPI001EEE4B6A|nr:magnesium transporter [Evansella clarkii]